MKIGRRKIKEVKEHLSQSDDLVSAGKPVSIGGDSLKIVSTCGDPKTVFHSETTKQIQNVPRTYRIFINLK